MRHLIFAFIISFNIFFLNATYSQTDGTWDPSFNAFSGLYQQPKRTVDGEIYFMTHYTNNTYLIGGTFTEYGGHPCNKLALLDSNFRFIDTFSFTGLSGVSVVRDAKVLPNGQIIIAGSFQYPNYSFPSGGRHLCRINSNGSIDTLFHNAPFSNTGSIQRIAIQPDGKIILCGSFITSVNSSIYVARFNADGSLDNTFTAPVNILSSGLVNDCAIQPDGKIIIGGVFTQVNSISSKYAARLNTDGSLDPTFQIGTGFNNHVVDIHLDTSGILMAGKFTSYNGTNIAGLIRLNDDGTVDTAFVNNLGAGFTSGAPNVDLIDDIEVQPDGKIIIDGAYQDFNTYGSRFMRLNSDGTVDPSVLTQEIYISNQNDILHLNDGRIVMVSGFSQSDVQIVRPYGIYEELEELTVLENDGTLDRNFHYRIGPGGIVITSEMVSGMAETHDGKVILVGELCTYNKSEVYGITKIHLDGSIDTSFHCPYKGVINLIKETPDSSFIIAGRFVDENFPSNTIYVAKIFPDGSIDPSFTIPNVSNTVTSMDIYPDGRIIVAGDFTGMKRIMPDGTNDVSFVYLSNNGGIYGLKVINQNELLVTGTFTSWGGNLRNDVAWLGPTGTLLPTTFGNVNGTNGMSDIYLDEANGFIYLCGFNYSGIYKYNYSGTNLTDFSLGTCGGGVNMNFLPDGRILFRACPTYDGYAGHVIVRANADGSIDLSFDRSSPINFGWDFLMLKNGSIISTQWSDTSTLFQPTTLVKLNYAQPLQMPFTVTGKAYKDMNGDNVFQGGTDSPIQHDIIERNGVVSASTNYSGNYTLYSSDTNVVIAPVSNILYHTANPLSRTIDFSSNPAVINADFAYQPIPGMNDLELSMIIDRPIRASDDFKAVFNIKNVGTTTITPTLKMIKDTTNLFVSSMPAYSGIVNDTMTIPLPVMAPNQQEMVSVWMHSPYPGYSVGDTVLMHGRLVFTGMDQTPLNNKDTVLTKVVASYDPNYKEVSEYLIPFSEVNTSTYLDYTIHFQNIGQSYAEDVYVRDSISPLLDLSTLEILCASDTMNIVVNANDPNLITFAFDDIFLPDSTSDEPGSHGFVSYRIKLNTPLINNNSIIQNTAYIFFDYNSPIITNTEQTVFSEELLSVEETKENKSVCRIYPNPVKDILMIETFGSNIEEIIIYDQAGRRVVQKKTNGENLASFNLNLASGIYLVAVSDTHSQVHFSKLVVSGR